MDNILRQLAERLAMLLMQEVSFELDIGKFCLDAQYASQVIDLAREIGTAEVHFELRQIKQRQLELLSLNGGSTTHPLGAGTSPAASEFPPTSGAASSSPSPD